mgnify:CR=1 FL=1
MRTLAYHFRLALSELGHNRLGHFFTIITVALAFLLAGLVVWVVQSVRTAQTAWSAGYRMTVVLERDGTADEIDKMRAEIEGMPGVRRVTLVTPEEARNELLDSLGPDSGLIVEMEPSFFPSVFDVVISGEPNTVRATARRLRQMAGVQHPVADVRSMDRWNLQFGNVFEISVLVAFLLCAVVLTAAGWILMNAARFRIEVRVDEMALLRSLGASPSFIRTPLILVSLFHGFMGGVLALGLLFGVLWLGAPLFEILLGPGIADIGQFVLFSAKGIPAALCTTAVTSWIAARLALCTVRVPA